MIPFLKNKQEAAVSSPDEVKTRAPDEDQDFELMDAIVEDVLEAVHSKDKRLLKSALMALIDHIKYEDSIQDELED